MAETATTLYLIPARGGSKGIPGKNIKEFAGKPLICYAIEQALSVSKEGDIVCVSTDSSEIARIAESAGADVPFLRPAELATDKSGTREVILHALDRYGSCAKEFDRVVLLQTTSPLRRVSDIRKAIAAYESSAEADMAVSVALSEANPYYDIFETDAAGYLHVSKGDGRYTRRQDAPKVWQYNGAVYVIRPESIRRSAMSQFQKIVPVEMERSRSIDLDTPEDWERAESRYNQIKEKDESIQ